METGKIKASLAQFEKAIRLYGSASPASQPVHEAYSKALDKLGKHELAQHELDAARELGKAESGGPPAGPNSEDEIRAMLIPPAPGAAAQKIPSQYLSSLKEALGNAYHNLGVILAQRSQYAD